MTKIGVYGEQLLSIEWCESFTKKKKYKNDTDGNRSQSDSYFRDGTIQKKIYFEEKFLKQIMDIG